MPRPDIGFRSGVTSCLRALKHSLNIHVRGYRAKEQHLGVKTPSLGHFSLAYGNLGSQRGLDGKAPAFLDVA